MATIDKEKTKDNLKKFDEAKAERDRKRNEYNSSLEAANSAQEQLEIAQEIKRKAKEEFLERIESGENYQTILNNTVNKPFKTMVAEFSGLVEYEYNSGTFTTDGKPKMTNRSFVLDFQYVGTKEEIDEYVVVIKKKSLCKKDILRLYEAFTISINEQMDNLLKNFHKLRERNKKEREDNLKLFNEEFDEAEIVEIPLCLNIFSDFHREKIELKFFIVEESGYWGIKLGKNNYLSCQDIYFLYTNFDRIINKLLNK